MLFVAYEILLAKEKQTFYKNKISEAIKSPAPHKHLNRQAAVMWRKLGRQGEGSGRNTPTPPDVAMRGHQSSNVTPPGDPT